MHKGAHGKQGNSMNDMKTMISADTRLNLFQSLSDASDLNAVLDTVAKAAFNWGQFDGLLINLVDEAKENLVCHWVSLPPEFENHRNTFFYYHFPLDGKDLNAQCFQSNRAVIADHKDVENSSGATRSRFIRWKMGSICIVPMCAEESGQPFGTIMALRRKHPILTCDTQFLQALMTLAGKRILAAKREQKLQQDKIGIENAALERNQFFDFINQINTLDSREKIYRLISKECLRRFPIELVSIWQKEEAGYVCKTTTAIDPDYIRVAERLEHFYSKTVFDDIDFEMTVSEVLAQNYPMYIEDVFALRHLPLTDKVRRIVELVETPRTFIHMPIWHKDEPLRVMTLVSCKEIYRPTEAEFQVIRQLSQFFGTVLVNSGLYETVKKQREMVETLNTQLACELNAQGEHALKDEVTGLYNYNYFYDVLIRRVNEFLRDPGGKGLSLVLISIDGFDALSNKKGRQFANSVMQEFAKLLMKRVRKSDIVCRFGGEEFAVILPGCRKEYAKHFAQSIQTKLKYSGLRVDNVSYEVTVSIGYSSCKMGAKQTQMLEQADQALALAKQDGGNRIATDSQIG